MTTAPVHGHDESAGPHPLLRGATPTTVREWLLPTDRDRFVAEYESALDEARRSLDLNPVLEVVERWRRVAALQSDRTGFRRAVRYAAEMVTGEPSPPDEPLSTTRVKAGM